MRFKGSRKERLIMGKRGVKRKKQGKITPPLTKLDKAVYIALMALSALVYVLFLMLYIGVKDNYALKTPEIIAYIPRGEFTYLIFPLTLGSYSGPWHIPLKRPYSVTGTLNTACMSTAGSIRYFIKTSLLRRKRKIHPTADSERA